MTSARNLQSRTWLLYSAGLARLLAGLGMVSGGVFSAQEPSLVQPVTFKSSDGLKIYGTLYHPKGDGPFPGIVRVHGGISGHAQLRADDFFVDHGFILLDVDYRGSDGHGKEFKNKLTMGGKEVDDVISGGKYLQSLTNIQKDKLAIMGEDRGAYITFCAVARSNPFKAAAAIGGFTDLGKQYDYESEIAPNFGIMQRLMNSSPLSSPEKYRDLSPLHFAGKINVPVLIVHGNNDRLVLPEHAWKMDEELTKSQKEHDIVILYAPEEDTGHTLKGKPLLAAQETILKWFNQHLFPEKKK